MEVTRDRYKVNEVRLTKKNSIFDFLGIFLGRFETPIDSTLVSGCRKGDSESRKHKRGGGGGDGFPTDELDRVMCWLISVAKMRFRANCFILCLISLAKSRI